MIAAGSRRATNESLCMYRVHVVPYVIYVMFVYPGGHYIIIYVHTHTHTHITIKIYGKFLEGRRRSAREFPISAENMRFSSPVAIVDVLAATYVQGGA